MAANGRTQETAAATLLLLLLLLRLKQQRRLLLLRLLRIFGLTTTIGSLPAFLFMSKPQTLIL